MAVAETRQPAMRSEAAATIGVRLAKARVHMFLLLIGILWLIPAAGLFVTSLLPAATANARGWWHFFGKPSEATSPWSCRNGKATIGPPAPSMVTGRPACSRCSLRMGG